MAYHQPIWLSDPQASPVADMLIINNKYNNKYIYIAHIAVSSMALYKSSKNENG